MRSTRCFALCALALLLTACATDELEKIYTLSRESSQHPMVAERPMAERLRALLKERCPNQHAVCLTDEILDLGFECASNKRGWPCGKIKCSGEPPAFALLATPSACYRWTARVIGPESDAILMTGVEYLPRGEHATPVHRARASRPHHEVARDYPSACSI